MFVLNHHPAERDDTMIKRYLMCPQCARWDFIY